MNKLSFQDFAKICGSRKYYMVTSKIRIYTINISIVLYGNKLSYTFISNWIDCKNMGPFHYYFYDFVVVHIAKMIKLYFYFKFVSI